MIKNIKKLFKKRFGKQTLRGLKNASYLTSGLIFTQLLGVVGMVVIARKLGAEQYGILAVVGAFTSMFGFLNLTGTKQVLVREGSKNLAKLSQYIERVIGLKNLFALLSILVTCLTAFFIKSYSDQIKILIFIFSVTHIFTIYQSFFDTIYQATEKMKYIAIFSIARKSLYTLTAIIAVYLGGGPLALILINIITNLFTLSINYRVSRSIIKFKLFSPIVWDKKLLSTSFIFTLLDFLRLLSTRIDLVMIAWMGSLEEAGLYAVAFKVVAYLQTIVGKINTSFFPVVVKRFEKGSVKLAKLLKISVGLFLGALLFTLILSFYSNDLIAFTFGPEYKMSGYILSILVFSMSFRYLTLPLSTSFIATGNEKTTLILQAFPTVLNIFLNYILYHKFGLIGIAYATLITKVCLLWSIPIKVYILKKQKRIV